MSNPRHFYTRPCYFCDDWYERYFSHLSPPQDYRFVYAGVKGSQLVLFLLSALPQLAIGTWTPFHTDVLRSLSWSYNVSGEKTWIIYPPDQVDYLRDINGSATFLSSIH